MDERSRTIAALRRITGFLTGSFILLLMTAAPAAAADRSGVTIRNDKFEVIHVVNDRRSVAAFRAIWNAKKKINSRNVVPHWLYKIDLSDGSRWLYDPSGYAMLASTRKVPLYKISPAGKFNRLIKAHP